MTCCIELETPQSILKHDQIDVFEEIIDDSDYEYAAKRAALWFYYRYRGIPTCNRDYWIQCMKDRYVMIIESYDIKIKAWRKFQADIAGGVSLADGSTDYTMTTEYEDTPDNSAGTTRYLASRTTQSYQGETHNDLESQTVRDYINAVNDPWEDFAKEFQRYFWIGV